MHLGANQIHTGDDVFEMLGVSLMFAMVDIQSPTSLSENHTEPKNWITIAANVKSVVYSSWVTLTTADQTAVCKRHQQI